MKLSKETPLQKATEARKEKQNLRSRFQITEFCHSVVAPYIHPGSICIDATMGNGNDTEFLCRSVGENGHVIAFDIQQEALEHTQKRLQAKGWKHYELHCCSHADMAAYAQAESISCILFNLGYLPSGDHSLATEAGSTIAAMQAGLSLLHTGGILGVCIYSGGDSGYTERDAVLSWLKTLDSRQYLVILMPYYNRPNDPPLPAFVIKL